MVLKIKQVLRFVWVTCCAGFLSLQGGALFSKEFKELSLNQALSETINNQWNIFISEMNITKTEGQFQSSKGPFDPVLGLTASHTWADTWSIQFGVDFGNTVIPGPIPIVGGDWVSQEPGGIKEGFGVSVVGGELSKKSRFGTSFALSADVRREINPFFIMNDPFEEGFGAFQIPYIRRGTANVTFKINQPILKGFLFSRETMNEKSLQFRVEAEKYQLVHTISQQLLDTIVAYWNLVKAHKLVKAYKDDEYQNWLFTKDVEELIKANQAAQTQLSQPLRAYENSKADVNDAKQAVVDAAQELSLAMGSPERYMEYCNPSIALDDFPSKESQSQLDCELVVVPASETAVENRNDLIALEYLKKASMMQVKGAYNETLPSLNLELLGKQSNTGYENGAKSVFKPFDMPAPKREVKVELSLNFPIFRDFGKGELKTARATKRQINYEYLRLRNRIISEVIEAINNHISLYNQFLEISEALKQAKIYVNEQKTLFKAGLTDLFQMLDSHQKQVSETIRLIEIEALYYQNIAKIYFLIGSLVEGDPDSGNYEIEDVTTLPKSLIDGFKGYYER